MLTSIVGYPRVGSLRELKFATEHYFKGQLTEEALRQTAADIRASQWNILRDSGLDLIPSNDFSFYDNVLDTAVLFHMIPKRYQKLGLSELDTYFAMARGYQGECGDVKALAMKKWFHTNYHYMVPEYEDDMDIRLAGTKPFDQYRQAKAAGIDTKIVITGAFTLLKLLRYTGTKNATDIADDLAGAYQCLLRQANELGASWVQFDEPSLVCDLTDDDIRLFTSLYQKILSEKGSVKTIVQTYFGDVRDIYKELTGMDFDAIGLDFIEGRQTAELIRKNGFPKDTLLIAGLVNGKNIWRNDYAASLALLKELKERGISVILGTSCSLLHVPYTLKNETKLSAVYREHFAFAEEKLEELEILKQLAELDAPEQTELFRENASLHANRPDHYDAKVQERVRSIKESNFTRQPAFAEREKLQKAVFKLPLLPTTTIGSFPQTADVKAARKAYKTGEISEAEYVAFNRKKIADCVTLQEDIGLDVLVHGEYERNDMVEYFGEQLNGYLFTENAWVQSYGTRCVKPPIIWGDVSRRNAMTVDWSVYAQNLTKKPMKGMLTGPVTILNWSFPREDISLKDSTCQIALAIRDEVLDLEAHGIRVIQIDEAALREKLPLRRADWYSEYLNWAIPAFRLVHSGVKADTQIHTHMCYSEFADIIPAIDQMDADVITFEASRSDLQILDSLKEANFRTEVGPGVYDIHSPRVPSVAEIQAAVEKMLEKIDVAKLWINPDCGLKTRGEAETTASLKNLVTAAKQLRKKFSSEML